MAYGNTTIGTAPYGPHWRNLRRLTALELLSPHRLAGSLAIRREEVGLLVRSLHEAAASARGGGFARVEMRSRLQELSFNIIMRMVSGKRYFGSAIDAGDAEVAGRFREVIKEMFELSGTDPGDFLPALRKVVDFKGRERRMVEAAKRSDAILQGLIDEVRSRRKRSDSGGEAESKTMIDTMLSEGYSDDIIKGHIMTMLSAVPPATLAAGPLSFPPPLECSPFAHLPATPRVLPFCASSSSPPSPMLLSPPPHKVIPQHLAFLLLKLLSTGSRLSTLLPTTPPLECCLSSSPTSSPSDALAVHSIARILDCSVSARGNY
ncbi:hypothetical protein NL676_024886 [Syzygium grande]|nr:hypothetical protein NL676_024886 [Syzygium grande]